MSSEIYRHGILRAYDGEFVAEKVYRELARRCAQYDQRAKFNAIADIERLTCRRLQLIAARLSMTPSMADWQLVVERRVADLALLSWFDFIDKALRDWPPYVTQFEALKRLAPAGDERPMQQLIDHEVVLVQFARLEHGDQGIQSLRTLQDFLGQES